MLQKAGNQGRQGGHSLQLTPASHNISSSPSTIPQRKKILNKNSQNILHLRPPLLLWSAKSALNVMANIVGNFGRHKKRVTITSLSVLGVISNGSNLML
jgi:hypothetical protein